LIFPALSGIETFCIVDVASCKLEFIQFFGSNPITPLTDTNCWWQALQTSSKEFGVELHPEIFPAATGTLFLIFYKYVS
jgi:hypothetical protein